MNLEAITDAIVATGAGAVACEEGALLVDAWINAGVHADKKIYAVECGFVVWLDDATAVIGVMDLLTEEQGDIVGNEHKTTGARSEKDWYHELTTGSQLSIYALGLSRGTYYERGGGSFTPGVRSPRIRVRAITKSGSPVIWPINGGGVVEFSQDRLEATKAALLTKAASVRAMRKTGLVPFQLPGIWCTNKYRKQCGYYSECTRGIVPPASPQLFSTDDPAYELAFPHLGDRVNDPELVVLGASAYASMSECTEKWRRGTLGGGKQEALALDIGSVLHAGVASWYRQLREEQNA